MPEFVCTRGAAGRKAIQRKTPGTKAGCLLQRSLGNSSSGVISRVLNRGAGRRGGGMHSLGPTPRGHAAGALIEAVATRMYYRLSIIGTTDGQERKKKEEIVQEQKKKENTRTK